MLNKLCGELRNWFEYKKHVGTFTISDGTINIKDATQGQYFRIVGSLFNDGVYEYPATDLQDEEFEGGIWLMKVPAEVVSLAETISEWVDKNDAVLSSPYQSESFGGYSYSKESGGNSGSVTWQSHFSKQLNRWRKI